MDKKTQEIFIIVGCVLLVLVLLKKRKTAPTSGAGSFTQDDFLSPALDYATMSSTIYEALYGGYFTDENTVIQELSKINTKQQYRTLSDTYIKLYPERSSWEFWKKGSKTGSLEGDILYDFSDSPQELNIVKNIIKNYK